PHEASIDHFIDENSVERPFNKEKKKWNNKGISGQKSDTIVPQKLPNLQVKRKIPDFSPKRVLDFGAGTGSGFWAMREVWPNSFEKVNIVEPSQSMQRASLSLIKDEQKLDIPNARNPHPSEEDKKLVVVKIPNAVNPLVWEYHMSGSMHTTSTLSLCGK
nr:methyltransferase-like protein 17, mitochondrial [Tanacetum cinerariifolium]